MDATYFGSPEEWRAWLEEHHETESELLVGFWKRGTGRPSMTWAESVDEALCFGWIDGVRRRVDDERYTIRFTPRRPRSVWSAVNVARVAELEAEGRMRPAGLAAFARRADDRTAIYSYEQRRTAQLGPAEEAELRCNAAAWAFFEAQPPSWRRAAAYWISSAKREETRRRRLAQLVAECAQGRMPPALTPPGSVSPPGP